MSHVKSASRSMLSNIRYSLLVISACLCFFSSSDAQEIASVFQYPMGSNGNMDGYFTSQTFNNYHSGYGGNHAGLDIIRRGANDYSIDAYGTIGNPVYAVANGIVVYSQYVPYPGDVVIIKHTLPDNSIVYSQYGHISKSVSNGNIVTIGQQIGTIWDQGGDSHLHFEIRNHATAPGPGYTSGDATAYGYFHPAKFIAEKGSFPLTVKVINTTSLNVRSDHSTSSTILGSLSSGEERTAINRYIYADGSVWYQIRYDSNDPNKIGWSLGANYYLRYNSGGLQLYSSQYYLYPKSGTLCGPLSGTLVAGTYNVTCPIYVNSGASLHIKPGVEINYNGKSFTVNGSLIWGP